MGFEKNQMNVSTSLRNSILALKFFTKSGKSDNRKLRPDLKLASSDNARSFAETDAMESLNISLDEANEMESLNISLEEANEMESLNISLEEANEMESLSISMEEGESIQLDDELDSATSEINQHEPDTALALAKAYIELGEEDIAKDFLRDVINGGSDNLKSEAEEMLAKLA